MQNHLADRRQVILIVRMTLDGHGQFVNGEIVDLNGERIGRFWEWSKMTDIVQDSVASLQGDNLSGSTDRRI